MGFYFPEELWSKEEKASLIIDKNTEYVHVQTNFLNCFTLRSDSLIMHIIQTKNASKRIILNHHTYLLSRILNFSI